MDEAARLRVIVEALGVKETQRHLGAVQSDLKGSARQAGKTEAAVDSMSRRTVRNFGAVAKASTIALGGGLIAGLFKSVDAAREAEVSQAKLQAQLKASGVSYKAHAAEIDNVIQKTANLAAVDDEDLQDAFTNILRVTGNVKKSLGLVGLAADVARAKHIDLSKAGELVGKVAGGNTGILSRYGIQVKKGATATEALGLMQKKFSGQAEAYGKTSAGAIDRAKNAVENLGENIGQALAPLIEDAANKTAKFVDQIRNGTGAGGKFRDALQGIYDKVKPVAKFFGDHPKLIGVAIGAWAAYKAASIVALAAIKVDAFRKVFAKSVPVAGEQGAAAGAAYAGGFDTTSAAGIGKTGKLKGALGTLAAAGGVVAVAGAAIGEAFAIAFYNKADKVLRKKLGTLGDLLVAGFGGIPGQIGAMLNPTGTAGDLVPSSKRPSILPTVGAVVHGAKPKPSLPHHKVKTPKAPTIRPRGHTSGVSARASRVTARASGVTAHASGVYELFHDPQYPSPGRDHYDHVHVAADKNTLSRLMRVATGQFGLAITSTTRSPSENAAAGGSPGSYHLQGLAFDASGSEAAMVAFANYVAGGGTSTSAGAGAGGGAAAPRSRGPSAASKARSAFQGSQKRARGAHGTATAAEIKRMTPTYQDLFDLAMADADVLLADTDPANDIIGLAEKGTAIQSMIKRIKKQLKGKHVSPKKRSELKALLADLMSQLKDLGQQAIDIGAAPGPATTPSPLDVNAANVALAGLTPDKADDLLALMNRKQILNAQLAEAQAKNDYAAIADLASQIAGLNDSIDSLQQEIAANSAAAGDAAAAAAAAAAQNKVDWANAALALAQLTPALEDDLKALNDIKAIDEQALKDAQAKNDPVAIAAAANALASVQSEIANLNDTLKQAASEADAYVPGKYVPPPTDTRATGDVHINVADMNIYNQVDANAVLNRLAFKVATA